MKQVEFSNLSYIIRIAGINYHPYFLLCHFREQGQGDTVFSQIFCVGTVSFSVTQMGVGFLQMAWDGIVAMAFDALLLHILQELLCLRHGNDKQMEHRFRIVRMGLHGNPGISRIYCQPIS